ncbi:plasmid pRiA4b ORF-3 family protein [Corynebacterium suedekumii]|uniref:Plasmid pRiA4b ORF-3 family protein n=1 Tax=Corynebacterium suedekumii TaxID=3049801 RepID=A0ABY8VRR5_9CORY|nr:plasmid pRiA4b ORF-3 family protein [Corynebacterium suedekumii]WIM70878.1 plasmid pRiA4b ORF-3 family protein [Corynebacterium suedekumii]
MAFRVRVDLLDTSPPVWRRLVIPGALTMDRVHEVLQEAMGWFDSHLHQFWTGTQFDRRELLNNFQVSEKEEGVWEGEVRLDQIIHEVGDILRYDYDFGDGWDHRIKVEEVFVGVADVPEVPLCVTGRKACPPEDCGGTGGYAEMARWVRAGRPDTFDSAWFDPVELRDWLDEDWHPDEFDADRVNVNLAALFGPRPALAAGFQGVLDMFRGRPLLVEEFLRGPEWTTPEEPNPRAVAEIAAPFQLLLQIIGQEGVKLTAQGYLPPAIVQAWGEGMGYHKSWIGNINRESLFPPAGDVHDWTKRLGLARRYKGVLKPTRIGLRAADDPLVVWDALVDSLSTFPDEFQEHAGWMTLVVVGSEVPEGSWVATVRALLTDLGWASDGGGEVPPWNETLRLLNFLDYGDRDGGAEAVAALARGVVKQCEA